MKLQIHKKGFTLIEIMVVVVIVSLIAIILFTLFRGALLAYRKGTNRALIYSEARAALDMMSREIKKMIVDDRRNIGWQLNCSKFLIKRESLATEFFFVSPLNPNHHNKEGYQGDLTEVGYWLNENTNTLMRHYTAKATDFNFKTGNSNEVIGNVRDLQVEYFDGEDWFQSTGGRKVTIWLPHAIKITLTMEHEEGGQVRENSFTTVIYILGSKSIISWEIHP